jgi:hypothetical protein
MFLASGPADELLVRSDWFRVEHPRSERWLKDILDEWDIPEEISRLYQPIDAAVAQIFAGAIRYRGLAGTMTYRYPLGAG